ncbi:MAG: hypothetical protein PCFJNLEI_03465 [Verrucomicrobiae bacterium]|nr:hypothetical protein [Verrucomicrobiae bacterium]
MLQCPKCNYDNELGRIFCHSCGAKLDLSQIKPPTEGAKRARRLKQGLARTIRLVVQLVIVALLILGIAMICLTPEVKPFDASNAELVAVDVKHSELEKLAAGRKGGTVVVSEGELNTFLNSLTFDKPSGKGIEVSGEVLRTTLNDGALKVEFVGKIHFGGAFDKSLYLAYDCTPVIRDGKCEFLANGGWLGQLPLHPKILATTPFVKNYFGGLFGKLEDDKKQLLDPLTKITVTKDAVTFTKDAAR